VLARDFQLPQHNVGRSELRILADEYNNAFGTKESYNLLDFLADCRRDVSEDRGLQSKKKTIFGFRVLQSPEDFSNIQRASKWNWSRNPSVILQQHICSKDVDRSVVPRGVLNQLLEIECWFAEKLVRRLEFEPKRLALDRSALAVEIFPY